MRVNKYCLFFLLIPILSISQTLKGKILDAKTNLPLETVTVYFDNTTIGTTTNEKGEFSISYNDAVKSTLVISYLGYQTLYVNNYRNSDYISFKLKESFAQLDQVVINTNDGMSRAKKLFWFRREFLGRSEFGKSCKILNEKDLKFSYNKKTKLLTAWSTKPLLVKNKALQYLVTFNIEDCEIKAINWRSTILYTGTSHYKNLKRASKKTVINKRAQVYKGSIQHFMRALYTKTFKEEGYTFGKDRFAVNPFDFFTISEADALGYKTITLKDTIDIFYKDGTSSVLQVNVTDFKVDEYGNYTQIQDVLFGGSFGKQRLGDMLPLDYNLEEFKN